MLDQGLVFFLARVSRRVKFFFVERTCESLFCWTWVLDFDFFCFTELLAAGDFPRASQVPSFDPRLALPPSSTARDSWPRLSGFFFADQAFPFLFCFPPIFSRSASRPLLSTLFCVHDGSFLFIELSALSPSRFVMPPLSSCRSGQFLKTTRLVVSWRAPESLFHSASCLFDLLSSKGRSCAAFQLIVPVLGRVFSRFPPLFFSRESSTTVVSFPLLSLSIDRISASMF